MAQDQADVGDQQNHVSRKGIAGASLIDLSGRVAIVTGAGVGLGRSYALALAARGAKVLLNDLGAALDGGGTDHGPADAVAAAIAANGGEAAADYNSVATPDGGEAIVKHALERFGAVDILINNAGNMRLSSFAKLDVRSIGEVLEVHLGGSFYVTHPAYRAMMEQHRGRIVFTSSGIGTFGIYGAGVYGAAKGGVFGLMNVLRLEGERHGILVNGVAPMARTRMSGDDLYSEVPAEWASPDLVAPVVVYLSSDECAVNGELWSVGAGSVSRLFVGRADGYFKHPGDEGPLSPEDVMCHVDAIHDSSRFSEPENWPTEWRLVLDKFGVG